MMIHCIIKPAYNGVLHYDWTVLSDCQLSEASRLILLSYSPQLYRHQQSFVWGRSGSFQLLRAEHDTSY